MPLRATVTFTTLLLLGLSLPGCADRDEAIPPALTELHQRASTGDASAQLELGLHYVTGKGIALDESAALHWIGLAAEQGEREALDGQPGLQAELSDAELQQARQQAQQYRQGPL